jgi:Spherulation-specific family 4
MPRLMPRAFFALLSASIPCLAEGIAVPSYFYPGSQWDQLASASSTVGLTIINPNSGPGATRDPNYVNQVNKSKAAGLQVIGYVYTKWGSRASAQVKNDIDRYYSWYGVDGIFLDEASTDCTKESYYSDLNKYVKSKGGKGITTINPGVSTQECYINSADIIVNFEGVYSDYLNWTATWETKYDPSRFWHLVYATPSPVEAGTAISLAKSRGAGWIYTTDLTLPNPWGALATYWTKEVAAVQPIYRPQVSNDSTSLRLGFGYNGQWSSYRTYLDTDRNAATGYSIAGLGADYLIENGILYKYVGPGWTWSALKPVAQSLGSAQIQWSVANADINMTGYPAALRLVFQVLDSSGSTNTGTSLNYAYTPSDANVQTYSTSNDVSRIYYQASISTTFQYVRFYIDTDSSAITGYQVGGIGADYLIENGNLYHYASNGKWAAIGTSQINVSGSNYSWWIWRSDDKDTLFSGPPCSSVLQLANGTSIVFTSPPIVHTLN